MKNEVILTEYFGNSSYINILDFLIQGQEFDYSMTEIARKSGVGWSAFTVVWKHLIKKEIVKQTRTIGNAKLFKLNKEAPFVKHLIKFDIELTKLETNKMLINFDKVTKKKVIA